MTWESLLTFNAVLLVALASPGAAMLYAVRTSVSRGRTAGLLGGIGLGTVAALWTLAAFLGLEGLFRVFPWAYAVLKVSGALYLLWLAYDTWRNAKQPLGTAQTRSARAFLGGMLINLANPKSVLFAAAVIVVVFPQGLAAHEIALVVLNHWLLEIAFYAVCAFALSTPTAQRGYLGLRALLDRIAALILGGLGLRLLLEETT